MTDKGEILVVDDTQSSLQLLTSLLTPEGYQVRTAESGELALSSVAAKLPDLILLDIQMPGMDGFEVFKKIKEREDCRGIPIIFLSAVTEMEKRVKGLTLGAVDFISKPFERRELFARVQTHVELHRLHLQLEHQAAELQLTNEHLQAALDNVKTLQGLLPICSSCKKIRDDKGFWNQVEGYISKNTNATFTHGICPECYNKLYGHLLKGS